ncbi:M20/M25/M40 family metallo-hydrolase [Opitutaceae bacterium]
MIHPSLLRRSALAALLAIATTAHLIAAADPATQLRDPAVRAALDAARRNEPETIELQILLNEIPAPPFGEAARAAEVKRRFEELGLKNVRIDKEGNVLGTRPGEQPTPHIVVAAHLDTVFPEGTDVKVRREGPVLHAPGIADDTRGVAEMLSVIRALNEGKVTTKGTITFVGTVGEEGLGDLRGVKALFNDTLKDQVDYFVAIDGGSPTSIINTAVGSYRYRVTFKGPGGHSYGAFGLVNPTHALGRAVGKIADIQVPTDPKTTFNVGRIGGGTSVNSIAFEAWMEIDMRSADVASLNTVRDQIIAAINDAVKAENARWKRGEVTVDIDFVGDRPAGSTDPESTIVKTAQATVRALGGLPTLSTGSTDSNYPIKLGVPAVTVGRGGVGREGHSLTESFDTTDAWKGPQNVILLITSLAN